MMRLFHLSVFIFMEGTNSNTTEAAVTSTPVSPVAISQPSQSKKGMFIIVGVLLAVAVGVGIFFITQLANKNAITVVEDSIKSGIVSTLDVFDFNKVSAENPIGFIDREKLKAQLSSLSEIGSMPADYNPAGKTEHLAFNLDVSFPVRNFNATRAADAVSTNKIMFKGDLYSKYPKDFDVKKYSYTSFADISNIYANLTTEDLMNSFESLYLNAEFNVDTKENNLAGNLEFTMIGFDAYVKFSNLKGDVTDELKSIENQLVRIDMTKHMEKLFGAMLKSIASNPSMNIYSSFDPANIDQMFAMLDAEIKSSRNTMPAQQVDAIKRLGNPIKNAIVKAVQGLDLFVNEKGINPIREATGVTCTSGDLNIAGIIEQGKNAAAEIADILKADEAFKSNVSIPSGADLKTGFSMYSGMISDSIPTLSIRLCNDGSRRLRGFGMDFVSKTNAMTIKLDLLTASLDSNKEITKPSADLDVTPQVDAAFEQIDFDMLFTQMNNPQTFMMESGESYGNSIDSNTEISGIEGLGDEYTEESMNRLNAYLDEYNTLYTRYENKEISYDEFLQLVEELSVKYKDVY